ncbi:3-hydroxyacyl-CoA dehydrogenase NAD-binding domain-containing protein [Microbacterium sp. NPDC055903]
MSLPTIATVVGSGTMGPGIAATLAHKGVTVRVFDISEDALNRARAGAEMCAKVLVSINGEPTPGGSVAFATDLAEALAGTELVIEAVPERLDIKADVLARVEEIIADDVIIATNTSGIPVSTIAEKLRVPERFIGMHWSNPPHLIPMIEVIPGAATEQGITDRLIEMVRAFDYLPVLEKEKAGFVENRVLYAVLRECVALLEEGIVSPADLDTCVKWGIGYKLAVIGPTRLLDMAGLDIYQAVSSYLNADLDASTSTPQSILDRIAEGRLGFKTGAGMYDYEDEAAVAAKRSEIITGLIETRKTLSAIPVV